MKLWLFWGQNDQYYFLLSNTGSKGTFLFIPSGSQMSFIVKIGHVWKPYGKSVLKHIHFYGEIKGLVHIVDMFKENILTY